MSSSNTLKLYTVGTLVRDTYFRKEMCKLARQCSNTSDSVTTEQVQPVIDHPYKGGMTSFVADDTTTVLNITHNLGAIPSFFTLTTTEPITTNHLNRTITFPDNNTMRITFAFAPNTGENANYVWIVYK